MVYYLTYRPQTIAQLDNPKLRDTLTAVLSSKNIPHAFLFTGPKGLGKTSTARIIAKVLNCTSDKRNGIEPCNTCEQCISITNGTNIDVLEIDGASNRGIDEIRELRERVNLAPSSAKKKVYIIDEVHMLTTEAFNALLKTIEEPPAHVVFIFATTEPQKVPATIISRCFHISLDRAGKDELVHALKRVAAGEKITIDDATLSLIAAQADGGFRDVTKILEELVLLHGQKVTKEMFEQTYKTANISAHVEKLLKHLSEKNAKESLAVIAEVLKQGIDMKFFIFQILSNLHSLLLEEAGIATDATYSSLAISLSDLQILIPLLEEAYKTTKFAVIPSLPLELAVVGWCNNNVIANEVRQSNTSEIASSFTLRNDGGKPSLQDMRKKEQNLKVKQVLGKAEPVTKADPAAPTHTQVDLPKDIKDIGMLLENLIYKVKPYNHSVAGVLRSCSVQSLTDEGIVFQTAYAI